VAAKEFFGSLESRAEPGRLEGMNQTFRFHVEGEGSWTVAVHDGKVTVTEGEDGSADVTIRTSAETFDKILKGQQNPTKAYMTGKIKIEGDLGAALKLQKLF
jgi:putative sterol carrier protein